MTKNVYFKTQFHLETFPLVPLINCWACGVLACHVRWRAAGLALLLTFTEPSNGQIALYLSSLS